MFFEALKEAFVALFLGVVQGVTEFLPISSTVHLGIASKLLGGDIGIYATNIISLGTTVAVIQYFWKDIIEFFKEWKNKILWLQIILATLPIIIATVLFKDSIETGFRTFFYFGIFLILGAGLLLIAEVWNKQKLSNSKSLSLIDYGFIGLFQALALFPGMSRSGSTLAGGLFLAKERATVVRTSFWISVPAFILAGVFSIYELVGSPIQPQVINPVPTLGNLSWVSLALGGISAYYVGLASLRWLIPYLQKQSSYIFIAYRFVVGSLLIIASFLF